MPKLVGITGTPGTGKKSVAPLVAHRLGLPCVGLNELAIAHGLASGPEREAEVDTRKLRREVEQHVPPRAVVYGHLLPHSADRRWVASAVVLRCEPGELKERLRARGYASEKLIQNVEAELIGLVSSEAFDSFGAAKTREVDTTHTTPSEAAEAVVRALKVPAKAARRIDWMQDYGSGTKLRLLLSTGG